MANQTANRTDMQTLFTKVLLAGMLAALILCIIILSCVPPVSRDALTHHLAIPKLYLQHGGMYEMPSRVFSYYPMNLDLLYLIPLYLGNDIAPKFIHFSFALLTAWLIFDYIKRRIDLIYGLLAAWLFLSIPIIIKLSITAYVDLGLTFFSTGSLLFILKWRANGFKRRHLLIAGLFCGLALGTKYNGLIVLLLLTFLIPLIHSRQQRPREKIKTGLQSAVSSVKPALLFMVTTLLVFSPWMIKNAIWTQNPVYPLYDRLFHPDQPVAGPQKLDIFSYRKLAFGEAATDTLLIPIRIFFQGEDDNPRYFDGRLNPYLLILPFFSVLGIFNRSSRFNAEKKILIFYSLLFLLFAFFSRDIRIRYVAPVLPPLVILCSYGAFNLICSMRAIRFRPVRSGLYWLALTVLSLMMLPNALYIHSQFQAVDPLPFIFGKVDRDTYIQRYRPEYQAIRYINQNLPQDAEILGFFIGNRGYYCERPIIFHPHGFRNLPNKDEAVINILSEPERYGITHLLIREDLFKNWLSRLPKGDREHLVILFQKKTELLYSKDGYGVFALSYDSFGELH